jgi:hypothetical protein
MSESGGSMGSQTRNSAFGDPTNVYEAMPQVRPEAIVLHCSDPRFQTAFEPFVENELGLTKGRYVPFVVAGGPGVLANPERRPKEFKFIRDRFELFHGYFASLQRLVLINHEDCAYYRLLAQAVPGLKEHGPDLLHWPRDDLAPIAQTIRRLLAHLGWNIELYYARFAGTDRCRVVFDRVLA